MAIDAAKRSCRARRITLLCCAAAGLAILVGLASVASGQGWEPVSYLPLAGSPYDAVTCRRILFTRSSIAFGRSGEQVSSDRMRTDRFAVETGRPYQFVDPGVPDLIPLEADGSVIYASVNSDLYTSPDGSNWTLIATLPNYIRSLHRCQSGTLLAAISPEGAAGLYRRGPGEQTFTQVLDFDEGVAAAWNYTETPTHLFVSEYGSTPNKFQPNPRRIYRSADDGLTWEVVYDPEYRDSHNHVLSWDAYTGRLAQTTGDGDGTRLMITSDDNGQTWEVDRPDLYQPVSALARPEGVYWGLDGIDPAGVARQERGSGQWNLVLHVGRDSPPRESEFDGNVFGLIEYQGLVLAPFANTTVNDKYKPCAVYATADGEHWVLSARFGYDWGIHDTLGLCGGALWMRYIDGMVVSTNNLLLSVGVPLAHRLVRGARFERAALNLWSSPDHSSAEGSLDDWAAFGEASLQADATVVWHGQQSIHVTGNSAKYSGVTLPVYTGFVPAGTTVSATVQVYGRPRPVKLRMVDDAGTTVAQTTFRHLSHRWSPAFCTGQLAADTTTLTVKLQQLFPWPGLDLWVDGIMLATGPGGDTWQIGGQPRAADAAVYDFDFPPEWTDIFLWAPDQGTDGSLTADRTLKVYEAADGRRLSLIYEPVRNALALYDSGNAAGTVRTPAFQLAKHAVLRVGVVQSATTRTVYVRIAENPYVRTATGAPLDIVRLYLGADPSGQSAAAGLLARNQLFDQPADTAQLNTLFDALISGPTPGDLDDDTDVDLTDLTGLGSCLTGPTGSAPAECEVMDFNGDGDVDLEDFRVFELAFTGAL